MFHTKDFEDPVRIKGSENITECRFGPPASPCVPSELLTPDLRTCPPYPPRYRDYRNAQDYNFSQQFWTLLAIRLAFLILFEVGRTGGSSSLPPPHLFDRSTQPLPARSTWPCASSWWQPGSCRTCRSR